MQKTLTASNRCSMVNVSFAISCVHVTVGWNAYKYLWMSSGMGVQRGTCLTYKGMSSSSHDACAVSLSTQRGADRKSNLDPTADTPTAVRVAKFSKGFCAIRRSCKLVCIAALYTIQHNICHMMAVNLGMLKALQKVYDNGRNFQ